MKKFKRLSILLIFILFALFSMAKKAESAFFREDIINYHFSLKQQAIATIIEQKRELIQQSINNRIQTLEKMKAEQENNQPNPSIASVADDQENTEPEQVQEPQQVPETAQVEPEVITGPTVTTGASQVVSGASQVVSGASRH